MHDSVNGIAMSGQSGWKSNLNNLPSQVFSYLPLTLFFPVAWMYAGVLCLVLSLLAAGDLRARWQAVRQHALLYPVLALSLVTVLDAIFLLRPAHEFWPEFFHYQIYLFLILFSCVGTGEWQTKAVRNFMVGAYLAASFYYLNYLGLLPDTTLFKSYIEYKGNKSILFGILLALASAWQLRQIRQQGRVSWQALSGTVYLLVALLFLSKTRTAALIFVVLCFVMLAARVKFGWRSVAVVFCGLALLYAGWQFALHMPQPPTCVVNDMVNANGAQKIINRAICTVHQVNNFEHGKQVGDDGMRLEIYQVTSQIIADKPLSGHGIGSWLSLYQTRAKGMMSGTMTTPHNDYLLYATETGAIGVLALLFIFFSQLRLLGRLTGEAKLFLLIVTVAMMIGGAFNAILRDGVFGMAFMILLTIPLAGLKRARK